MGQYLYKKGEGALYVHDGEMALGKRILKDAFSSFSWMVDEFQIVGSRVGHNLEVSIPVLQLFFVLINSSQKNVPMCN